MKFTKTVFSLFWLSWLLVYCNNQPSGETQNRLANASSPYLRSHADNPVDWYEWGEEALNRAKREDKPLLISIGYASCHWCHQMEDESFMDTAVARLMNENFVCIKVDREERPDIDNLYLHACQLLNNGEAGWPLNAFALPDGKPFFAGTYFAKDNWKKLLENIAASYKTKRNKVIMQANSLTFGIIDNDSLFLVPENGLELKANLYPDFFHNAIGSIDLVNGGIKGNEKFPTPSLWQFFLQYHFFTGDKLALDATVNALDKMALGGLYDHAGGGFFRYSTDSLWQVPHFEKMLNDNAQLISLYAQAYRVTKDDFYKQVITETISFVENELSAKGGAFYSSVSAQTTDGEGVYYFWEPNTVNGILGNNSPVAGYFSTKFVEGQKGMLRPIDKPQSFAKSAGLAADSFGVMLADAKQKLLNKRNKRNKPPVDNKIILSWNALMLNAYIDAYTALGNKVFLEKANSLALFLEKKLVLENGKLFRVLSNDKVSVNGFLEDYALLSRAFIGLYQAGFNKHWLLAADKITGHANQHFLNTQTGLYYFSPSDTTKLAVEKMDLLNNIMPSSNAVMGEVLFSLGVLLENQEYLDHADSMFNKVKRRMAGLASASPEWGVLAGMVLNKYYEVAIVGPDALQKNLQLQSNYLAGCYFLGGSDENLPLLKGKKQPQGTWIYVCSQKLCKQPDTEVETAFSKLLPEYKKKYW